MSQTVKHCCVLIVLVPCILALTAIVLSTVLYINEIREAEARLPAIRREMAAAAADWRARSQWFINHAAVATRDLRVNQTRDENNVLEAVMRYREEFINYLAVGPHRNGKRLDAARRAITAEETRGMDTRAALWRCEHAQARGPDYDDIERAQNCIRSVRECCAR